MKAFMSFCINDAQRALLLIVGDVVVGGDADDRLGFGQLRRGRDGVDRFGGVAADWRPIRCIRHMLVWFVLCYLGQHVIRKSPMCYIKNITPNKK